MFLSKKLVVQGEEKSVSACRELTVRRGDRVTEDTIGERRAWN